jgi:hypothetical protein
MTEQQLRDVLARVVPEPPDSVADAAPVVRVARRRRQARVAGVAALAAVLVAGSVVGVRALGTDHESRAVDQPKTSDPYTTAPCPDATQPWASAPLVDLGAVTAVRFCARDLDGFDTADGPRDALVDDVSAFTQAIDGLGAPDPARCAALDVVPTDSRLLFQLADGTEVGVPAGFCQDAEIGGGTLDGGDLTKLFLAVLQAQRGAHEYAQPDPEPARCAFGSSDISPAQPGHDRLVAATECSSKAPLELTAEQVGLLQQAWDSAQREEDNGASTCSVAGDELPVLFVRTDRGDNLQLQIGCDDLTFYAWDGTPYVLDQSVDTLLY